MSNITDFPILENIFLTISGFLISQIEFLITEKAFFIVSKLF